MLKQAEDISVLSEINANIGSFDISVGALASTGYVYCTGTYGAA